jgi:hypothetical protein
MLQKWEDQNVLLFMALAYRPMPKENAFKS